MFLRRIVIRLMLIIPMLLSMLISIFAIINKKYEIINGCFAVIAAVISAWIATKSYEAQEDLLKPEIEIKLDIYSTMFMPQLIISNMGKNPAVEISIIYNETFLKNFSKCELIKNISSLNCGEEVHLSLGSHGYVFSQEIEQEYVFDVFYKDRSRRKFKKQFNLDFNKYKNNKIFTADKNKAMYLLSKYLEKNIDLTNKIDDIKKSIVDLKI